MHKYFQVAVGLGLLIMTGYSAATGNEAIFPSALILFVLFLVSVLSARMPTAESTAGKAAGLAVATFVVLIAVTSLLTSLFLPAIANYWGITGWFDGDFVRVTINDAHEFAYSTCLLLLLNVAFLFFFRSKSTRLEGKR